MATTPENPARLFSSSISQPTPASPANSQSVISPQSPAPLARVVRQVQAALPLRARVRDYAILRAVRILAGNLVWEKAGEINSNGNYKRVACNGMRCAGPRPCANSAAVPLMCLAAPAWETCSASTTRRRTSRVQTEVCPHNLVTVRGLSTISRFF